jgi:hypothetical protein
MAQVRLDGIHIDVPHHLSPEEVLLELERFAQDLSENRFPAWGVHLERVDGRMLLRGAHDGSRFEAVVVAETGRVLLELSGVVEIGFLKHMAAGGDSGVRDRVRSTLADTLTAHLGG